MGGQLNQTEEQTVQELFHAISPHELKWQIRRFCHSDTTRTETFRRLFIVRHIFRSWSWWFIDSTTPVLRNWFLIMILLYGNGTISIFDIVNSRGAFLGNWVSTSIIDWKVLVFFQPANEIVNFNSFCWWWIVTVNFKSKIGCSRN